MTCPKCNGEMRSYERNGVTVDQCPDCRGLFLDRGELERLIDAESAFHSQPPAPRYDKDHGYGEYSHHGRSYKKRKKNFLEELFD
jgi:Zn-finger nucleic acid-binding protein